MKHFAISFLVCHVFLWTLCITVPSIQDYVNAAVFKGLNQVTIPPGTYYEVLGPENVHLNFTNVKDFTLNAYGVTMMCTVRARAIDMTACTNVTIKGLIIDYQPLTFTQGTIVDINAKYLDLKIHAGYPVMAWPRINVIDPKTLFFKDGMGFMWDITANITQPGIVRVYRTSGAGFYTADVGDFATLAGGPDQQYACHGIAINFCSDMSLIDTTLYCAPGFGIADWGGDGGLVLSNFQIVPGPLPPKATEQRLQTTSWDGIQHNSVGRGPLIHNSKVELAGDDTWSALGGSWQIVEIQPENNIIKLAGTPPYTIYAGDVLRLYSEEVAPAEQVTVVKVGSTSHRNLLQIHCSLCEARSLKKSLAAPNFTVYVDRTPPANWNVSDYLFSPNRQSSGFIFQNNYVRSKGRGSLVKAPHGLIQNNYYYGGTAGVEVSPEIDGTSGSDACVGYDLTIRNNTIVHTGYHETFDASYIGADGAIAFFSYASGKVRPPNAFRNMVIEGNSFSYVNGINIGLTSSVGVTISQNVFTNTMPISLRNTTQGGNFGFKDGYIVFLNEDINITLSENVVYGKSQYTVGNLYASPSVMNITGENGGITQK